MSAIITLICHREMSLIWSTFKLKEFADGNFKFDETDGDFSRRIENTVGKGEIARRENVRRENVRQSENFQQIVRYIDRCQS